MITTLPFFPRILGKRDSRDPPPTTHHSKRYCTIGRIGTPKTSLRGPNESLLLRGTIKRTAPAETPYGSCEPVAKRARLSELPSTAQALSGDQFRYILSLMDHNKRNPLVARRAIHGDSKPTLSMHDLAAILEKHTQRIEAQFEARVQSVLENATDTMYGNFRDTVVHMQDTIPSQHTLTYIG